MAEFTVRVVLHDNPSWDDYEVLYAAMGAQGLVDVIVSNQGHRYKMPPGEYYGKGDVTADRAREIAAAAAMTTGKRHAIFVTEASRWAWQGLERM